MKWYRKLYVGETAGKDRYRIVGKVRWNRPQRNAYLITLAANESDLLDIYPANTMLWPYFRKNTMEGIVAKEMYIRGFLDYERLVCEKDSKI